MTEFDDIAMMRRALELAQRGVGLASPGALVGAVIVRDGVILGESFYTYDGVEHAEIRALRQAGDRARGATVYVTQEPCSHFGRTPPCADALIQAGVSRVVCAIVDPNPAVNGKGIEKLRAAGIPVLNGVLENEARRVNEGFVVSRIQKRPFGILKLAMTLDGKIATGAGESKWITSEESRNMAQQLRHSVDAVVTGSGTFLKDQPRMTDRTGLPRRRDLLRVVLDRRGRISAAPDWLVFRGALDALIVELAAREVQSFLLECGPELAFSAVEAGIMDKVVAFIAPKLLGGSGVLAFGGAGFDHLRDMITLHEAEVQRVGPDFVLTAYLRERPLGASSS